MKINLNRNSAKRFGKRFLLLMATNLFTIILVAIVGTLFLAYVVRDEDTCSAGDKIDAIDSLYSLKTDLVKENATITADARYYDAIEIIYPAEGSDLEKYIFDKTTRDLKIGRIFASINEIDDIVARVKKCDYSSDQIDQRMATIRDEISAVSPDQSKLQ